MDNTKKIIREEYEQPLFEVVVFLVEEGIAMSTLSGSDAICTDSVVG